MSPDLHIHLLDTAIIMFHNKFSPFFHTELIKFKTLFEISGQKCDHDYAIRSSENKKRNQDRSLYIYIYQTDMLLPSTETEQKINYPLHAVNDMIPIKLIDQLQCDYIEIDKNIL